MPTINISGGSGPGAGSGPASGGPRAGRFGRPPSSQNAFTPPTADAAMGAAATGQMLLGDYFNVIKKMRERDAKLKKKLDDDQYRIARSEAEFDNRRRDKFQRDQERIKKKRDDDAYRWMRSEADFSNRRRDQFEAAKRRDERKRLDQQYRLQYQDAQNENRRRSRLDPFTYRAENVTGIGRRAQRYADTGQWYQLHQAERELNRIGKLHGSNPGVASALAQARARIAAGKEGQSPWRRRMGVLAGGMEDVMGGGLMALAPETMIAGMMATAAWSVMKAPLTIARTMSGIMSSSAPYTRLRYGMAGYGRGTGIDSRALEGALLPNGPAPDWMKALGVGAPTAMRILQQYGIAPSSNDNALGVVKSIAGAQYSPLLGGMGFDTYAQSAKLGSTLGATDSNSLNTYFRMLQGVMSTAVAQGVDRSDALSGFGNLMKQAGSGAASIGSGSGMANFFSQMLSSGFSSMRSGAGITSVLEGANAAAQGFGFTGDSPRNMMLSSYVQRHGGIKAFASGNAALNSLFGEDVINKLSQTDGGRMLIQRVHEAAATGNALALNNALQPLFNGNPEALQTAYGGSIYGGIGGYYGTALRQTMTGYGAQGQAAHDANPNARATVNGGALETQAWDFFRSKGYSEAATAGILANIKHESGFNPTAVNASGHAGIGQWDSARQRDFAQMFGHGIGQSSYAEQLQFYDYEMSQGKEQAAGARVKGSKTPYDAGYNTGRYFERDGARPGGFYDDTEDRSRGNDASSIYQHYTGRAVDPNNTPDINAANANNDNQQLLAAKTVWETVGKEVGDKLGDDAMKIGAAISSFDVSVANFAKAVEQFVSGITHSSGMKKDLERLGDPAMLGSVISYRHVAGGPAQLLKG